MPIKDMTDSFIKWSTSPERSVLFNNRTGEYLSVLTTKRGNGKYAAKIRDKLNMISGALDDYPLFELRDETHASTRGVFLTLEFNPYHFTDAESWAVSSVALNRFKAAALRIYKKYFGAKDFEYFSTSVKEAHESGYCHIHFFQVLDLPLEAHLKQSRKRKKLVNSSFWRIDVRLVRLLKAAWDRCVYHSWCELRGVPYLKYVKPLFTNFLDIQAVVSNEIRDNESGAVSNVAGYILKYMAKPIQKFKKDLEPGGYIPIDRKAALTHALQKAFNVRTIFSKKFLLSIGLGGDYLRHDLLKNELKQLREEYDRRRAEWGSLEPLSGGYKRLSDYAAWIDKEIVPFYAVVQRQFHNLSFSFYEKFKPERWEIEKAKNPERIWDYVYHVRFAYHFDAKPLDMACRKYFIPSKLEIETSKEPIPDGYASTPLQGLQYIVVNEDLLELSPDFNFLFI